MFNIYQSGGQGLKKPHCGQLFSSIFDHSRKNNGQALLWLLLWGSTIAITTPMRQASTSDRVRAVRLLLMTVGLSAYSSCQAASACLGTCAPAPTRASCAPGPDLHPSQRGAVDLPSQLQRAAGLRQRLLPTIHVSITRRVCLVPAQDKHPRKQIKESAAI